MQNMAHCAPHTAVRTVMAQNYPYKTNTQGNISLKRGNICYTASSNSFSTFTTDLREKAPTLLPRWEEMERTKAPPGLPKGRRWKEQRPHPASPRGGDGKNKGPTRPPQGRGEGRTKAPPGLPKGRRIKHERSNLIKGQVIDYERIIYFQKSSWILFAFQGKWG